MNTIRKIIGERLEIIVKNVEDADHITYSIINEPFTRKRIEATRIETSAANARITIISVCFSICTIVAVIFIWM